MGVVVGTNVTVRGIHVLHRTMRAVVMQFLSVHIFIVVNAIVQCNTIVLCNT